MRAIAAPILFDVEFAEMGGEGATPYEVLLHAAVLGDSMRFTRQDQVEETWRIMQPLLDAPPGVHSYEPGSWGPEAADALVAEHGGWRDPWVRVMSAATSSPEPGADRGRRANHPRRAARGGHMRPARVDVRCEPLDVWLGVASASSQRTRPSERG